MIRWNSFILLLLNPPSSQHKLIDYKGGIVLGPVQGSSPAVCSYCHFVSADLHNFHLSSLDPTKGMKRPSRTARLLRGCRVCVKFVLCKSPDRTHFYLSSLDPTKGMKRPSRTARVLHGCRKGMLV